MSAAKEHTALAVRESNEIGIHDTWTDEQVDLIKRTVANGASDIQVQVFLEFCLRRGLDPLTKQVYWTPRGLIVGIDGMRAKAEETSRYRPDELPAREARDKDGKLLHVEATVYKWFPVDTSWHPVTMRAYLAEYDAGSPNWRKMPYVMLSKCAESLALRKAFPHLSGLYVKEEMEQADAPAPPASRGIPSDAQAYAAMRADWDTNGPARLAEHAATTRDRCAAVLERKAAAIPREPEPSLEEAMLAEAAPSTPIARVTPGPVEPAAIDPGEVIAFVTDDEATEPRRALDAHRLEESALCAYLDIGQLELLPLARWAEATEWIEERAAIQGQPESIAAAIGKAPAALNLPDDVSEVPDPPTVITLERAKELRQLMKLAACAGTKATELLERLGGVMKLTELDPHAAGRLELELRNRISAANRASA